jgi:signal peptidase II
MALLVVLYCYMNLDRVGEISMILIISGGISNTISRILYNGVPDWMDFDLFGLISFPSFNLADLMIDLSVVLLIISLLKKNFEFRRTG